MSKSDIRKMGMFQSLPGDYETANKARSACPVSALAAEFDPFNEDYVSDPFKFLARARVEEPIFYSPEWDYWVVTKYDDIVEIFRDTETFSAAIVRHPVKPLCPAAAMVRDELDIAVEPMLVDEEDTTHRRHRRIFGDAFTPKRVEQVEPRIRAIVQRYIEGFASDGHADLVGQMLYEIPALMIFIFLGADEEDAVWVKRLASARAFINWGKPTDDEQAEGMRDMGEHWQLTKELVDRTIANPGDNYLGDMARLYKDDPSLFTLNYFYNVVFGMMFAGHETTTQTSANGMKHLLQNPDQWQAVCDNPELIPNAVEEILRIEPSIFGWRRYVTRDTEVGGQKFPEGSRILMYLGSGNRDDDQFPEGHRFDVTRENARRHLGFGHGAHFCMGAPLARLELRVVLEELSKRLPHMKLTENQKIEYVPTLIFRGMKQLSVEWDPRNNPVLAD